jgi:hypothetical protein
VINGKKMTSSTTNLLTLTVLYQSENAQHRYRPPPRLELESSTGLGLLAKSFSCCSVFSPSSSSPASPQVRASPSPHPHFLLQDVDFGRSPVAAHNSNRQSLLVMSGKSILSVLTLQLGHGFHRLLLSCHCSDAPG